AATSPVWAPFALAWQFWPPTSTPLPLAALPTARPRVGGGQISTSRSLQPACFTPSATPVAKARPSARRPFIFQLPAMSGRLVRALDIPRIVLAGVSSRPVGCLPLGRVVGMPASQNPFANGVNSPIMFRKYARFVILFILFGMLIVSFAFWGVGDMLRMGGRTAEVAQIGGTQSPLYGWVGGASVSVNEVKDQFNRQ